jgi:hypothetical protein
MRIKKAAGMNPAAFCSWRNTLRQVVDPRLPLGGLQFGFAFGDDLLLDVAGDRTVL